MTPMRRGTILVAAIVCLLIAMLVSVAIVRALVLQQRQARTDFERVQAMWLAESAASRAAVMLRSQADYQGELWKLQVESPSGPVEACAEIVVTRTPDRPDERLVRIESRLPANSLSRTGYRKQLTIQLPQGESKP